MLRTLLQNVQSALKSLRVENCKVEGFLLGALEVGSPQSLTFSEVNWMSAWGTKGLRRMFEFFTRNSNGVNVHSCNVQSKATALRKVAIGIYVDEVPESSQGQLSNISDGSEFKNWHMPFVEE